LNAEKHKAHPQNEAFIHEAEAAKAESAQLLTQVPVWGRHFGVLTGMSGMSKRPGVVGHRTPKKKQHRPPNTRLAVAFSFVFQMHFLITSCQQSTSQISEVSPYIS